MLRFEPFVPFISPTFWLSVADLKLRTWMLDESPHETAAVYHVGDSSPLLNLHVKKTNDVWNLNDSLNLYPIHCASEIITTNTLSTFRHANRSSIISSSAEILKSVLSSRTSLEKPESIIRSLIYCHCDLKKHKFYFSFAAPTLTPPKLEHFKMDGIKMATEIFSSSELERLSTYGAKNSLSCFVLCGSELRETTLLDAASDGGESIRYLVFFDPGTNPSFPGWPLRMFLLLLSTHPSLVSVHDHVNVLCIRHPVIESSLILNNVSIPKLHGAIQSLPVVGWETTKKGTVRIRVADMKSMREKTAMVDSSIHLNLELMKWRQYPSLRLDTIQNSRCLLIGAGTLGCNVARALLGWGVCNITFVDYGTVSLSNPVRQSLYDMEDEGKPKAIAAAERLHKIYPSDRANFEGKHLSIPMPGHFAAEKKENVVNALQTLMELVDNSDVVFLLTDTRESRWLPTLLCARKKKIMINTALGFDSYVVMRSPLYTLEEKEPACYFCSDVTAPTDSLTDRTVDMACTVTRSGVSFIASALAVEIWVCILHNNLEKVISKYFYCATIANVNVQNMGSVPHQIRGYLSGFEQMEMHTERYEKCVACSDAIMNSFDADPGSFTWDVCKNPNILEELSGLSELRKEVEQLVVEERPSNSGDPIEEDYELL